MIGHTARFQEALTRPHTVAIRIQVRRAGQLVFEQEAYRPDGTSVWFHGGSILRVTLSSRVTRVARIVLAGNLYPRTPADVFAPWGNELAMWRGIRYGDGTVEDFPIFTGPITGAAQLDDGRCEVRASDRAQWVIDAGFTRLWSTRQPNTEEEFKSIIIDAVADAQFRKVATFGQQLPKMTWEFDRGQALDDVVKAVSAVWLTDAAGLYMLMPLPWGRPVTSLRTLSLARDSGTVSKFLSSHSRDDLFNEIVAASEQPNGKPPITSIVADQNPGSPSFIGGAFRRKTAFVESAASTTRQQLRNVAEDALARGLTWTEAFTVTMAPDPTIELGDAYTLAVPEGPQVQVVTGFDMPLDTQTQMTVSMRSPSGVVLADA